MARFLRVWSLRWSFVILILRTFRFSSLSSGTVPRCGFLYGRTRSSGNMYDFGQYPFVFAISAVDFNNNRRNIWRPAPVFQPSRFSFYFPFSVSLSHVLLFSFRSLILPECIVLAHIDYFNSAAIFFFALSPFSFSYPFCAWAEIRSFGCLDIPHPSLFTIVKRRGVGTAMWCLAPYFRPSSWRCFNLICRRSLF